MIANVGANEKDRSNIKISRAEGGNQHPKKELT